MLKICLGFLKSEPQYAYKRYVYKKTCLAEIFERVSTLIFMKKFFPNLGPSIGIWNMPKYYQKVVSTNSVWLSSLGLQLLVSVI